MSTLDQIEEIDAEIEALKAKQDDLHRHRREEESRTFIEANGITLEDVEVSDGGADDLLLRSDGTSRWVVWRGRIYDRRPCSATPNNVIAHATPGKVEHLPEKPVMVIAGGGGEPT